MKYLWTRVWVCICLMYACSDKIESADVPEVWSEAQVRNQLSFRWSQGDTLPSLHNSLRTFFPEPWEPFIRKEVSSAGIYEKSAFFSHAETVYFQSDGSFIEIYIADYAADHGAFIRLIQEFEKVQSTPGPFQKVWTENVTGVFAWEHLDKQSQLHYLEAGAYARFHILIRTNLPEAQRNLSEAWQKIAWAKLKELKARQ